jgi:hypothetical protein
MPTRKLPHAISSNTPTLSRRLRAFNLLCDTLVVTALTSKLKRAESELQQDQATSRGQAPFKRLLRRGWRTSVSFRSFFLLRNCAGSAWRKRLSDSKSYCAALMPLAVCWRPGHRLGRNLYVDHLCSVPRSGQNHAKMSGKGRSAPIPSRTQKDTGEHPCNPKQQEVRNHSSPNPALAHWSSCRE